MLLRRPELIKVYNQGISLWWWEESKCLPSLSEGYKCVPWPLLSSVLTRNLEALMKFSWRSGEVGLLMCHASFSGQFLKWSNSHKNDGHWTAVFCILVKKNCIGYNVPSLTSDFSHLSLFFLVHLADGLSIFWSFQKTNSVFFYFSKFLKRRSLCISRLVSPGSMQKHSLHDMDYREERVLCVRCRQGLYHADCWGPGCHMSLITKGLLPIAGYPREAKVASSLRICLTKFMTSSGAPQSDWVRQGHEGLAVFTHWAQLWWTVVHRFPLSWCSFLGSSSQFSVPSAFHRCWLQINILRPRLCFGILFQRMQPATVSINVKERKNK